MLTVKEFLNMVDEGTCYALRIWDYAKDKYAYCDDDDTIKSDIDDFEDFDVQSFNVANSSDCGVLIINIDTDEN